MVRLMWIKAPARRRVSDFTRSGRFVPCTCDDLAIHNYVPSLRQERAAIELDENGDVRPQTTPLPTAVVSGRSSVATLGAKEGLSAARRWPRQAACVGASPVAAFLNVHSGCAAAAPLNWAQYVAVIGAIASAGVTRMIDTVPITTMPSSALVSLLWDLLSP